MKKRIGKFFIILGVIFFCLTPFSVVKADDTFHYNVFDVFLNSAKIGSGEYTCYRDYSVANNRTYVREITVNFATYWRGELRINAFTASGDYILVEGASISSAASDRIYLWLGGSNYVHVKIYSQHDFDSGWTLNGIEAQSSFNQVERSPGESRQEIVDALDTSNDNWTSMLSKMQELLRVIGTNTNTASLLSMISDIQDNIDQIEYFDNGIYAFLNNTFSPIFTVLASDIAAMADNIETIAEGLDLSNLEGAINALEDAINNLSGNISIVNNIDLSAVPPVSLNAYLYFSKFTGVAFGLNNINYPYFSILQSANNNAGTYTYNRRIFVPANSTWLLCFFSTVDITSENFPLRVANTSVNFTVSYSQEVISNLFMEKVFFTNPSNAVRAVSFDLILSNNIQVIPVYLGDVNAMNDETQQLVQYKLPNTVNDYHTYFDSILEYLEAQEDFNNGDLMDKLDDIISAINNLSINVDMDIVSDTVNDFNVDITTVHNIENNFNTSFNTYLNNFNNINRLDDTSWFSPVLFNHIFHNIWNIPRLTWVLVLILFCVLIVAILGIRK